MCVCVSVLRFKQRRLTEIMSRTPARFPALVDYTVGREHELYPPAAATAVLEQVDNEQVEDVRIEQHLIDVVVTAQLNLNLTQLELD